MNNQQNYQNYQQPNYQQQNQYIGNQHNQYNGNSYNNTQNYGFNGQMMPQQPIQSPKKNNTSLIIAIALGLFSLCFCFVVSIYMKEKKESQYTNEYPTLFIEGYEFQLGWTLGDLEKNGIFDLDAYSTQESLPDYYFSYFPISIGGKTVLNVTTDFQEGVPLENLVIVAYAVYNRYDISDIVRISMDNGAVLGETRLDDFLEENENPEHVLLDEEDGFCNCSFEFHVNKDTNARCQYIFENGVLYTINLTLHSNEYYY